MHGTFKSEARDFLVDEIPLDVPRKPDGKYIILKVRLKDWDTNRFVIQLARELHISNKRISYCGTKDKRGITTQYFCVNHDFDPSTVYLGDCQITEWFRSDMMLRLGDLVGNRFTVNIHTSDRDEEIINECIAQINDAGGFPNYFGLQRFGSVRTNTHLVGKYLVLGRDEEAALEYLCDPQLDTDQYRRNFLSTLDAKSALKEFPQHLNFERSLLGYMAEHGSLKGSLAVFPKNLRMIFVHAYQSYLFNRILSQRIREIGMNKVEDGDLLMQVDEYFNPTGIKVIRVNSMNRSMVEQSVRENKLRPTVPLIGFETEFSGGRQGEIEREIMDKEGITREMFRIRSYPDLSSSGEKRITSSMPVGFLNEGKGIMTFSLGRGIYATSLLREFLKENMKY